MVSLHMEKCYSMLFLCRCLPEGPFVRHSPNGLLFSSFRAIGEHGAMSSLAVSQIAASYGSFERGLLIIIVAEILILYIFSESPNRDAGIRCACKIMSELGYPLPVSCLYCRSSWLRDNVFSVQMLNLGRRGYFVVSLYDISHCVAMACLLRYLG